MDLQQPTLDVVSEGESDGLSELVFDYEDEGYSSSEYSTDEEYASLPKVPLSSLTETGQDESTIPVLRQRSYTGRKVIPSAVADTLCIDLGVDGVLEKLNTALGTFYSLDSVGQVLETYIAQNCDFGTAYAYLRHYWNDIHTMEHNLRTNKEADREMRRNVLIDGWITKRDLPPRRVWDLCANRVVPYWVAHEWPWGISHAWVDGKDRVDAMTPINGYEWPVPMPKDANLNLIRIEMLNKMRHKGPECAWLEVLCLRQEGGKGEHLRLDEWKLDVPTIGAVYHALGSQVVCYFSGLGRPLHLTSDDFESDRCWFRRAWTLQETRQYALTGGKTDINVMEEELRRRCFIRLISVANSQVPGKIVDLVSEMQTRVSTKPLDKVAGLAYIFPTVSIPVYNTEQSEADAWELLMDVMSVWHRAQLLFFYFEPGDGRKCWRPSWDQVMTKHVATPYFYYGHVFRTEDPDTDYYEGYHVESGNVHGLSVVPKEPNPRQGELVFKDTTGALHTLKIVADHPYPVPDGLYTLIGCVGYSPNSDFWVVGQLREDGKFKKLSVFRSADGEKVKLMELGFEPVKTFLC